MSTISFKVYAPITGKQRPRFRRIKFKDKKTGKSKEAVTTYTPSKTHNYEEMVKAGYIAKYPSGMWVQDKEQPIGVRAMEFHFKMPDSWSKKKKAERRGTWCLKKPDIDNIFKSITDALNGVAFHDDSQICGILGPVVKIWDDEEFVSIELMELEEK